MEDEVWGSVEASFKRSSTHTLETADEAKDQDTRSMPSGTALKLTGAHGHLKPESGRPRSAGALLSATTGALLSQEREPHQQSQRGPALGAFWTSHVRRRA